MTGGSASALELSRPARASLCYGPSVRSAAQGRLCRRAPTQPVTRRCRELVERLRYVVHERVPLALCDAQVPVRALHVLAGVFLRTSGGPAQHLGNQIFEACRRYLVVRIVDQEIGVEPRVGHYAIDEVVYDGRDAVD